MWEWHMTCIPQLLMGAEPLGGHETVGGVTRHCYCCTDCLTTLSSAEKYLERMSQKGVCHKGLHLHLVYMVSLYVLSWS